MSQTITVPQLVWHNPKELKLQLPSTWQIEISNFAGYRSPALTETQIESSITNLIESPPIRELAKRKKEVVIIFDDMTRCTKTYKVLYNKAI